MTCLIDLNLLIALAWPTHVHHDAAHRWFRGSFAFATCPMTQVGFIRVSSNRAALPDGVNPIEAQAVLARVVALERHTFRPDDLDLGAFPDWGGLLVVGHRQVTDTYLLSLASRRGGRLATLDHRLDAVLQRDDPRHAWLELVAAE